ncbi:MULTISPECIES: recombinase family protein [unclassified Brucella]|uniref:recombinase family protein n=1 Tax=unclassified Brucella TaxID=2632610 RepID=UPI0012AE8CE8|nr:MULTISPECIES: recombinase family protein [unclassified Brucella]MRN44647.1 recombinase family protein [Brucella sp. 09RB8913]MRN58639.1 recombinase family protein [Brucella sp. 09RB8918]
MRVALYARYSFDNQRDASIEDQLRICRARAEKEGWTVVDSYTDRAISGSSLLRPGVQELITDGLKRRFDVILTESLDRLSRDQEDIAGLYKRMRFAGVSIVTLSEGEVSELHIGLKGTMGALYIKDLADKTRRGLRGRIEDGKSGGGLSYGYDVVRQFDQAGEASRGERAVNEAEANVVRRIFTDYLEGKSSRAIAMTLNSEGVPGPQGSEWGPSTIHGNPKRGTGILNNELYIGKLVWNRLRYIKDPDTGKRVSRPNPESEWIIQDVPELRIVDQYIWEAARERQQKLAHDPSSDTSANFLCDRRRPKHLFTGLIKCGCCGGGYSMISKHLLGCTNARNKGTCNNWINIRRDTLEASVLNGLDRHLMEPELFKDFCEEFTREVNKARIAARVSIEAAETEIKKIDRELERILDLYLKEALTVEIVKERGTKLETRKKELNALLDGAEEPPALLHPNMAKIYHEQIEALHDQLHNEATRAKAAERLRSLVSRIELVPNNDELAIVLRGDLTAILSFASDQKNPNFLKETAALDALLMGNHRSLARSNAKTLHMAVQVFFGYLVAGAGFEPAAFRL